MGNVGTKETRVKFKGYDKVQVETLSMVFVTLAKHSGQPKKISKEIFLQVCGVANG